MLKDLANKLHTRYIMQLPPFASAAHRLATPHQILMDRQVSTTTSTKHKQERQAGKNAAICPPPKES